MIEMSPEIGKLAAALHKAQGLMGGAVKDAKNPAFKSKYATLETVIDVAKPALNDCGIFFTQAPGAVIDGNLELTTMLVHGETGQWMRSVLQVPLPKRDPQGLGSAVTYARRYSLMAILGIPAEDDDGEAAKAPDWTQEGRELAKLINAQPSLEALAALWQTDRVKAFIAHAPNGQTLVGIKDERKHVLAKQKEAA